MELWSRAQRLGPSLNVTARTTTQPSPRPPSWEASAFKRPEVSCLLNVTETELPAAYLTAEGEQVTAEDIQQWLHAHGLDQGLRDEHVR